MAALPHYRRPALILIKPGVVMLILAAAYLRTEYGSGGGWSWLRQLGTTSLVVHRVSIEVVYGACSDFGKNRFRRLKPWPWRWR